MKLNSLVEVAILHVNPTYASIHCLKGSEALVLLRDLVRSSQTPIDTSDDKSTNNVCDDLSFVDYTIACNEKPSTSNPGQPKTKFSQRRDITTLIKDPYVYAYILPKRWRSG